MGDRVLVALARKGGWSVPDNPPRTPTDQSRLVGV
eukprot:XP_001704955.1 Hypothetical protein GL50803_27823 [Giardia lamblia ATCC 50803]